MINVISVRIATIYLQCVDVFSCHDRIVPKTTTLAFDDSSRTLPDPILKNDSACKCKQSTLVPGNVNYPLEISTCLDQICS